MFEVDEYIHLAIHAASRGDPHACMSYLKEALRQQPGNASAIFLLAAQHAELGLAKRAIDGFTMALSIEPGLEAARLQLGVLLLDRNRPEEAKVHFARLAGSTDATLGAFAAALSSIADGHVAAAHEKIRSVLAAGAVNRKLMPWLQRVADDLEKQGRQPQDKDGAAADRIYMGAYGQP